MSVMSIKWQKEMQIALESSRKACEILKDYFGRLTQIRIKGQEGLVSEADQNAEMVIREVIAGQFPEDSILGEEQGLGARPPSSSNGRQWIVDPLDGTTNYVHRFPFFAVSIGFECDGEMQLGIVEAPLMGWRFTAIRGQGAFLNDQKIACSQAKTIEESLMATGFSYSREESLIQGQVDVFKTMVQRARGVRRAGAASLDLCLVANGVFDAYWENTLKPWDTAAGALIAKEAGCIVTDYSGQPYKPQRDDVLAATPGLHKQILDLF